MTRARDQLFHVLLSSLVDLWHASVALGCSGSGQATAEQQLQGGAAGEDSLEPPSTSG